MAYQPLIIDPAISKDVRDAIQGSIERFLRDVHAMLRLPDQKANIDAGCNYSAALALCCVIGATSRLLYPRKDPDGEAFKQLLTSGYFPWEGKANGGIDPADGAEILYDLRCELAHAAGLPIDQVGPPKNRTYEFVPRLSDPKVKKYDGLTEQDVEQIERASTRPSFLGPTIAVRSENGRDVVVVLVEALYWGVRRMVEQLASDSGIQAGSNTMVATIGLKQPIPTGASLTASSMPLYGYTIGSTVEKYQDAEKSWFTGSISAVKNWWSGSGR